MEASGSQASSSVVRKTSGPLTKKDMEKVREFGGDDYISMTLTNKSNEEFKKEVDGIITEFEEVVAGHEDELRSIVFARINFAIALVGKNGCRLGFKDGSAFLDIPSGALDTDKIIYMYRLPEDTDVTGPRDEQKIFSYSPLIACGPDGTKFKEDVTLNFQHCAAKSSGLVVFGRDNEDCPWMRQDITQVSFERNNRVEHHLSQFCQRCCGDGATGAQATLRLRMCLIIAVSRASHHCVEAVLLRDMISLINAVRNNFLDARGFRADEVHVLSGFSLEPSQHVTYEGSGGLRVNGPNDWNHRGFYSFIIPASKTGRFDLNLKQSNSCVASVSITEQGDIETDLEIDPFSGSTHYSVEAESFGRPQTQCPDVARRFADRHNLQTYDGQSSKEQWDRLQPGLVLASATHAPPEEKEEDSHNLLRVKRGLSGEEDQEKEEDSHNLLRAKRGRSGEEDQGKEDSELLPTGCLSDRVERQLDISCSSHRPDDAVESAEQEPTEASVCGGDDRDDISLCSRSSRRSENVDENQEGEPTNWRDDGGLY